MLEIYGRIYAALKDYVAKINNDIGHKSLYEI